MLFLLTLIAVGAGVAFVVSVIHRDLVVRRDGALAAWDAVDEHLRRRHGLVGDLVAVFDGHDLPDGATREGLREARDLAAATTDLHDRVVAEQDLGLRIAAVLARTDLSPALAANDAYQDVRADVSRAEDAIDAARHLYNVNQQRYALRCLRYPNSVVAANGPFPVLPRFDGW